MTKKVTQKWVNDNTLLKKRKNNDDNDDFFLICSKTMRLYSRL